MWVQQYNRTVIAYVWLTDLSCRKIKNCIQCTAAMAGLFHQCHYSEFLSHLLLFRSSLCWWLASAEQLGNCKDFSVSQSARQGLRLSTSHWDLFVHFFFLSKFFPWIWSWIRSSYIRIIIASHFYLNYSHFRKVDRIRIIWVGRDNYRSSSPFPLKWTGTHTGRSRCSESSPSWPWMSPG